jgi:regulator of ribonuclease activity A
MDAAWTTCDLADEHGERARVVPPGLHHFGGATRFTGAIETVSCRDDNSRVREIVRTPGEGRVLVVDGGGSLASALVGDMLAAAAAEHGWVGIVVDGCVRDTAVLQTLDIGVMGLATNPRRSARDGEGVVGGPIDLHGVPAAPGDLLFADADGIVLLPVG